MRPQENSEPRTLDYFNSRTSRTEFPPAITEPIYRIALVLWFVPLILGICNYSCWVFTQWEWFLCSGKVVVVTGFASAAVCLIFLGWFVASRLRARALIWSEAIMPAFVVVGLLLLSFLITVLMCAMAYPAGWGEHVSTGQTTKWMNDHPHSVGGKL